MRWHRLFWVSRGLVFLFSAGAAVAILLVFQFAARRAADEAARASAAVGRDLAREHLECLLRQQQGWQELGQLQESLADQTGHLRQVPGILNLVVLNARGEAVACLDKAWQEELAVLAVQLGALAGQDSVQVNLPPLGKGRFPVAGAAGPLRYEGKIVGGILMLWDRTAGLEALRHAGWVVGLALVVVVLAMNGLSVLTALAVDRHRVADLRQLSRVERAGTVESMARTLAHELRNPLNALSLGAQLQQRLVAEAPIGDALKTELDANFRMIQAELKRVSQILESFVRYADHAELELSEGIDLAQLAQDSLALLSAEASERGIQVQTLFEPALALRLDPDRMKQVVLNLVRNALDAMPQGGTLSVGTRAEGRHVLLSVQDTGTGIKPEDIERIFDPYFSTKATGMGLGLAISRRIVEAHAGTISVSSEPGKGSVFTVRLPLK